MKSYKITKQIIGEDKVSTLYDGMYLSEAKETLKNISRNGKKVIDMPMEITIVNEKFSEGVNYKIIEMSDIEIQKIIS